MSKLDIKKEHIGKKIYDIKISEYVVEHYKVMADSEDEATDIMTWANAGPGAMRGLNRLTGRPLEYCLRSHDWNSEMQELLKIAFERNSWVTKRNSVKYELREIELSLIHI